MILDVFSFALSPGTPRAHRYNIGTDFAFSVRVASMPMRDVAIFFAAMALATTWSGYQVLRFVSASLASHAPPLQPQPPPRGPLPPALHAGPVALSFGAWVHAHRAWFGAVAALGCLQMFALQLIVCGAVGAAVGGPMAAPVDAALWRRLLFHATATYLLRSAGALSVVIDTGGYLNPVVFLKLAAAVGGGLAAGATLVVDSLARRHGARGAAADGDPLAVALVRARSVVRGARRWFLSACTTFVCFGTCVCVRGGIVNFPCD